MVGAFHPREVIVDNEVIKLWSENTQSTFEIGLLVGQVSQSNNGDFVLTVVPIPSERESGEPPIAFSDVSVDWVQVIAQQVDRLLPGGISVLGLYVVTAQDVTTKAVQFLRAAAEAVALPVEVPADENVHYLAIVSTNGDIHFQSFYNVVDVNKSQMLPAKRITSTTAVTFKQYRTLVDLDEPISFRNCASSVATVVARNRMNEVEEQLKQLFRRVEDSIAVHKLTDDTNVRHINLLTLPSVDSQKLIENPLGSIHGAISCVAFVAQSEPDASGVAASYLKRDFTKSLLVRVALARERYIEDDEAKPISALKEGGVIRLAQRGLVPWPSAAVVNSHFLATVHVFPDENVVKAVDSALEILGGAYGSGVSAWIALETSGQLEAPLDLTLSIKKSEPCKHLYYMLPIVLVLLLVVFQNVF